MDDTARMARCLKITDPRALTLAYKLPLTKQECEWGLLMGKSLSPRTSGSHLGRLSAQGHEVEAGGSFAGRSWVAGGCYGGPAGGGQGGCSTPPTEPDPGWGPTTLHHPAPMSGEPKPGHPSLHQARQVSSCGPVGVESAPGRA